ncbi:hypothetical protein [Jeotgalibacillus sp. R-1-5s-1]|uniref:hypothetical protein n=1 Tax=Jeotgalibacillus sp. R-1-5s-1 TaxID=2555897 RepID=UPI00106A5E99|nr:hypothetical protein [Jeotgalibacillus sp. R-1-5s-1]TFD93619.1 hypothetical protein E2491_14355 [Jeotgalibacillus sp. R-1-5s-1]
MLKKYGLAFLYCFTAFLVIGWLSFDNWISTSVFAIVMGGVFAWVIEGFSPRKAAGSGTERA